MQTFKIEHTYGCGSIGELYVEADTAELARQHVIEDYAMDSSDILSVEEITVTKAAA